MLRLHWMAAIISDEKVLGFFLKKLFFISQECFRLSSGTSNAMESDCVIQEDKILLYQSNQTKGAKQKVQT